MVQSATLPPLVGGEWIPMSWEAFLDWCDEGQSEWVDGKGIAYVSNSLRQERTVRFLGSLLDVFIRVCDLGEVFEETMLARLHTRPSGRMPDVFVVGRTDRDRVHHQWVDGAPLLAVEVISEESVDRDLREKRDEYERAGIQEYLIVDARLGRQGFTCLRLDGDGHYQSVEPDQEGRYHSAALPGFWLDPNWFRQEPLPEVEDLLLAIAPEAYEAWLLEKIRARRATTIHP